MKNDGAWSLFDTFLMFLFLAGFGWCSYVLFVPQDAGDMLSANLRLQNTGARPDFEAVRAMVAATAPARAEQAWTPRSLSGRWKWIAIHHSATAGGSAESIDAHHRARMENGLAYHFLIGNGHGMGDGQVFVGRRWQEQLDGGHLDGGTLDHLAIGICLVGNFEETAPTEKQIASLKALILFLQSNLRISTAQIRGHRQMENEATLCPGRYLPVETLVRFLKPAQAQPPTPR